jgi:hypothetical protein
MVQWLRQEHSRKENEGKNNKIDGKTSVKDH